MFDFKSFTENLGPTLDALTPKITVPFAAAGWILFYIHQTQRLIPLPTVVVVSALVVAILSTCLAFTSLVGNLWNKTGGLRQSLVIKFHHYRDRQRIQEELQHMTPKERKIIAYLLAKQQKMFEVLPDGEEAATLIAKGFIVWTIRKPPAIHRDITVEIPAQVWTVLLQNRAKFPYEANNPETDPWRTNWMAR